MASPIVRGQNFGSTETVTATKLQNIVDNSTFKANDGSTQAFNVSGSTDIGTCVKDGGLQVHTTGQLQVEDLKITTGKLADSSSKTTGVTFAKMQHISTAQVLGRLSASEGDVEEVGVVIGGSGDAGLLFDNDDMLDNSDTAGGSATRGATQQSIKAYVDGGGGFTPTSYTGGETTTLPNGLIMKFGTITATANSATSVNFGEGFSAVVSAQVTFLEDNNTDRQPVKIGSLSASTLTIRNTNSVNLTAHWLVFGK